jgi:hypothetical protein
MFGRGRFWIFNLTFLASRLAVGVIIFAAVATERDLLVVGAAVCVVALIAWDIWWLRNRRRS